MFNTMYLPPRCPGCVQRCSSHTFPGANIPKPCQGFWSIASPERENPASEERNFRLAQRIAPGWSRENEEKWYNSEAYELAEIMRQYGYPHVSCGRMDPLLYYRKS